MAQPTDLIRWAARVSPGRIRRLYRAFAQGIIDEPLLDEVAYGLYARCQSILAVKAAKEGRVTCPQCGATIARARGRRDDAIACASCEWATTWFAYRKTFLRKQLNHGGAADVFEEYVRRLPSQQTPSRKMMLVDWLLHECHKVSYLPEEAPAWVRPIAPNLLDATMEECVALLDELAGVTGREGEQRAWRQRLDEGRDEMMRRARGRV
jgi:predicted RNA-binding Zn-ribbon protein involved in translation (DUF1610 family)